MIFGDTIHSTHPSQWKIDLGAVLGLFQAERVLDSHQILQAIPRLTSGRVNRALQHLVETRQLVQRTFERKRDKQLRFNYRLPGDEK